MGMLSKLIYGSVKFNSAIKIIQDVGSRIGDKYGHNNVIKYLAIYTAGEFIKGSMESGEYQYYGDKYQGTAQQKILRQHLSDGISRMVNHGLDPEFCKKKILLEASKFEAAALDALIYFVETNKEKNPPPKAFFAALKSFYKVAEKEMEKGFRYEEKSHFKSFEKDKSVEHFDYENEHARINKLCQENKYSEAIALMKTLIDNCTRAYGNNHYKIGHCHQNLARIYRAIGDYENAFSSCFYAIAVIEKLGNRERDLASLYCNISLLYADKEFYDEAEIYCKKSIELVESIGKIALKELGAYNDNMAMILFMQKKYSESELYCERGLIIFEGILEKNHPKIKSTKQNLADIKKLKGAM
jgi:tetratricopeptide (TPR) repeat protein